MPRQERPPIDWDEAFRLHEEDGWSFAEIAGKFGYSPTTIRWGLEKLGVKMHAGTRRGEMRRLLRQTWKYLHQACSDPKHRAYHVNGAQGFRMCPQWREFEAFYLWSRENGYRPGLSVRVERGITLYSPENCRWTKRTQILSRIKRDYGRVDFERAATLDWDEIKRLYVDEQLDPLEIARRFDTTRATINVGLHKFRLRRERRPGLTSTDEGKRFYRSWHLIHARCENTENKSYRFYGARGSRVAAEWREFEPFLRWAQQTCKDPSLVLTRKDSSRSFSSKNCEWTTYEVAANRRRAPKEPMPPRKLVLAFRELRGVMEWSRDPRCNVSALVFGRRINQGWSPERALTEPAARSTMPTIFSRELDAWGQTQGEAEWLRDRRCRIGRTGLVERLARGWTVEAALSTPPYHRPKSGGKGSIAPPVRAASASTPARARAPSTR